MIVMQRTSEKARSTHATLLIHRSRINTGMRRGLKRHEAEDWWEARAISIVYEEVLF
jgi:hypothetical protein